MKGIKIMIQITAIATEENASLLPVERIFSVKTISAAWNKIREIRNTFPEEVLEGLALSIEIDGQEGVKNERLPEVILFRRNTSGKIEFKDFHKLQKRQMDKAMKADKALREKRNKEAAEAQIVTE